MCRLLHMLPNVVPPVQIYFSECMWIYWQHKKSFIFYLLFVRMNPDGSWMFVCECVCVLVHARVSVHVCACACYGCGLIKQPGGQSVGPQALGITTQAGTKGCLEAPCLSAGNRPTAAPCTHTMDAQSGLINNNCIERGHANAPPPPVSPPHTSLKKK